MCTSSGSGTKDVITNSMDEEEQVQHPPQQELSSNDDDDGINNNNNTNTDDRSHKKLPIWYPHWKGQPIYDGNPEVLGWILCSIAESIQYIGSGAFFVNTVLLFAKIATQCRIKAAEAGVTPEQAQCGPTFGDINPSSLLAMYATVIGVCSAMFLPLTGALIDYSHHRRLIGRISSTIFVLLQIPTIFLNERNYPIILFMHGCAMFVGWIQMSMLFAYLPELTDSETKLASYTKSITVWTFVGMMVYLVFVVVMTTALGEGKWYGFTNALGMGVAFAINAVCFPLAWGRLFDKRGPLHDRPMTVRNDGTEIPARSLFATGFTQLWQTATKIFRNYRSLKWFYISIAFSEAAGTAFSVTAITYMTTTLGLTPTQNGIALCIWLCGSIPGAFLSTFVARRTDPLRSTFVYLVLVMINVVLFSQLTKPGKVIGTYAIMFSCGISGGWKNNMDRLVSSSIIPKGQDGEMMGFYLFAGQSLTWLPLIVYTAMNQAGVIPSVSIVVLDVYFAMSFIAFCLIGSYPNARKEVHRETVYGSKSSGNCEGNDDCGGGGTQATIDARAATKDMFGSEIIGGDCDSNTENFSKDADIK